MGVLGEGLLSSHLGLWSLSIRWPSLSIQQLKSSWNIPAGAPRRNAPPLLAELLDGVPAGHSPRSDLARGPWFSPEVSQVRPPAV